jgi:hypothetical protein
MTAEPASTIQIGSLRVCLIESINTGGSARGFEFCPKCFFLRMRSFSSPTIPVLASEETFWRMPLLP